MGLTDRLFDAYGESLSNLIIIMILRSYALLGGCLVAGMYGPYVNNARVMNVGEDPKFLYAVICGGLGGVLAVLSVILPFGKWYKAFALDFTLAIMFFVLFGIFANIYVNQDASTDGEVMHQKTAVFIDLGNAAVWLVSGALNIIVWLKERRAKKGKGRSPEDGKKSKK